MIDLFLSEPVRELEGIRGKASIRKREDGKRARRCSSRRASLLLLLCPLFSLSVFSKRKGTLHG